MGQHINIGLSKFPKQSEYVGFDTDVIFNYKANEIIKGKIVRDDMESPFITIIQLEDGRILLSTECQYRYPTKPTTNEIQQ